MEDLRQANQRFDWVDAARGFAMIFVYIGHWVTAHLTGFAYSFHLQLFFIISGFFAINYCKLPVKNFLKKITFSLFIPSLLWCFISFIFNRLDQQTFETKELLDLITNPSGQQPNYWFFPAMIAVMIVSYFMIKTVKRPWIFLLISFVLLMLFGENTIINSSLNPFVTISKFPVLSIIDKYIAISAIPQYLFFYALGCFSFKYIYIYMQQSDKFKNKLLFNSVGLIAIIISAILMLKDITGIAIGDFIKSNLILHKLYVTLVAILISFSVLYLCYFLGRSKVLTFIGRNSMSMMGLEFITHSTIPLAILPMLNLGIPNIQGTVDVIIIVILQFMINYPICKLISNCFPILNGKLKICYEICSKKRLENDKTASSTK